MQKIKLLFISFIVSFVTIANASDIKSFAPLIKKTLPAVVSIKASVSVAGNNNPLESLNIPKEFEGFFEDQLNNQNQVPKQRKSQGSGFIFSESGLVITNNHVIKQANEIKIILQDGTSYDATIKGVDPLTDLAVLQIQGAKKPLPMISFGDSEKSEVGDWVIAIGNPHGLGGTVTKGIISARGRNIQSGLYDDYIQTDTPINRGNSGGPLINMNGEVIGINTAIISPTGGSIGLGFSIPSKIAQGIANQLAENGKIRRGWLGVSMRPVTAEIADSLGLKNEYGTLVTGVQPASPADKATIKLGDIILAVNGNKITKVQRLPSIIASSPVGKAIEVVLIRDNKIIKVLVTLVERVEKNAMIDAPSTSAIVKEHELQKTGLRVTNLTTELRQRYNIKKDVKGILVVGVSKKSGAFGVLPEGSVITRINTTNVVDVNEAKMAVKLAVKQNKKNILLVLETGSRSKIFITINLIK